MNIRKTSKKTMATKKTQQPQLYYWCTICYLSTNATFRRSCPMRYTQSGRSKSSPCIKSTDACSKARQRSGSLSECLALMRLRIRCISLWVHAKTSMAGMGTAIITQSTIMGFRECHGLASGGAIMNLNRLRSNVATMMGPAIDTTLQSGPGILQGATNPIKLVKLTTIFEIEEEIQIPFSRTTCGEWRKRV